jgi:outer membrane immunogenic protein
VSKVLVAVTAVAALLAAAAPALAADMAIKAAAPAAAVPVPAAAYDWSGFYIGGDAGWQGSGIGLSDPITFGGGQLNYKPHHDSLALGAFVGAQHQFGQLVLGVEGGYMSAFGNDTFGTPILSIFFPGGTGSAQVKLKDIWSVGGRAGWAVDQWMPYLTGGYANGAFQFNAQNLPPFPAMTEQARANTVGGYIGGGVDRALMKNWIIGVEYRHYAFGAKTVTGVATTFTETVRFAPSTDTLLARLSYKFD